MNHINGTLIVRPSTKYAMTFAQCSCHVSMIWVNLSIPTHTDASIFAGITVTTQVFRLKAEVGFYDLGFK